MEQQVFEPQNINGWGSDADFKRRPYYPIHKQQVTGAHWSEPEQQISDVEILKSSERPEVSAVFGTTLPPQGLSNSTFCF